MVTSLGFQKIETNNLSTLFPSNVSEWNRLDLSILNYESLPIFKKNLLHFRRPALNSI